MKHRVKFPYPCPLHAESLKVSAVRAGFLTYGQSFNPLGLPIRFQANSGSGGVNLKRLGSELTPNHSGGTAADFHGLPY